MARPRGSRIFRGWVVTPTEMVEGGVLNIGDVERVVQGGVEVTQIKPDVLSKMQEGLKTLKYYDKKFGNENVEMAIEAKARQRLSDGPIDRKVKAEEKRIRNNPYETGVLVTQDGRVLRVKGEQFSVGRTPEMVGNSPGSVFTHNHPRAISDIQAKNNYVFQAIGGNSFSPGDVAATGWYHEKTLRAVTPKLTFSLTNNDWKKNWERAQTQSFESRQDEYNRLKKAYETKAAKVGDKGDKLVAQGLLTRNEMAAAHWHLVAKEFTNAKTGYGKSYEYSVTGALDALAELTRIENIYFGN